MKYHIGKTLLHENQCDAFTRTSNLAFFIIILCFGIMVDNSSKGIIGPCNFTVVRIVL